MSDPNPRIEQFRKMADADPNNELGHFSLGKAYLDAGQTAPAIGSFQRVIELNPNIAKVYHMLAAALLTENRKPEAIERLTQGVAVAAARGDLMPKNEMIKMLKDLGAPVPESVASAPQRAVGEGQVLCNRCGKVGRRLPEPPFSNAQGKVIQEKICADCWREWIHMGTKVINELRLPLSDPQAQKIFDQHMREFLNLT
ncbi:MAG: Fe(2+)-trafficking protein [Tepidisphaeraceae bacterium]|jgi:Fe-S cluster biosynthesis and repair protein YggX